MWKNLDPVEKFIIGAGIFCLLTVIGIVIWGIYHPIYKVYVSEELIRKIPVQVVLVRDNVSGDLVLLEVKEDNDVNATEDSEELGVEETPEGEL